MPSAESVTLYHGTSTLFLDSIVASGLGGSGGTGGKSLLESWGVFDLMNDLASERSLWGQRGVPYALAVMASQSKANLNFQHGHTYLSPSKLTARRYARSNAYGSEILSEAANALINLREGGADCTALLAKYPAIAEIMCKRYKPILISLPGALSYPLQTEHGEDPRREVQALLEGLAEDGSGADTLLLQSNFRLLECVPVDRLLIEEID